MSFEQGAVPTNEDLPASDKRVRYYSDAIGKIGLDALDINYDDVSVDGSPRNTLVRPSEGEGPIEVIRFDVMASRDIAQKYGLLE
jgi:hypothetical protein